MVAQISGFNKIAIATAFTLAAGAVTIPGQNVAHAETRPFVSFPVDKCLQGADEELTEQIKKTDAVGATTIVIDLAMTGGAGTVLYGAVSAIVGCIKGLSNDSSSNPQRPSAPFEKYGGNWNYGNDK